MSASLTRDTILLKSFERAAHSVSYRRDALNIPMAANGLAETHAGDSIFRTTDK